MKDELEFKLGETYPIKFIQNNLDYVSGNGFYDFYRQGNTTYGFINEDGKLMLVSRKERK